MVGEPQDIAEVDIDYYDPDEEPATDNLETDAEALPGDDEAPALEAEAEGQEEEQDERGEPGQDPEIDLGDGLVLKASEVRAGYMRDKDYRQKTEGLARANEAVQQSRQMFQEQGQRLNSLLQGAEQWLESLIPEPPSFELARTNPSEYQAQKALHEQVGQLIQQVKAKAEEAKGPIQQVQQLDRSQAVQRHVQGLEQRFPQLRGDQSKLVQFVQQKRQDALSFGFTPQEVGNVTDDRLLTMAHYAVLGQKAEHNRNNAKRRLENPKKGNARPATGNPGKSNTKAMQRLSQTGSLKDALMVDFD